MSPGPKRHDCVVWAHGKFFFIWFFLCKLTNLFLSFPRLYIPWNEELTRNDQRRHVTTTCQHCHVTTPRQCCHVTTPHQHCHIMTAHHLPPASRATARGVDSGWNDNDTTMTTTTDDNDNDNNDRQRQMAMTTR